MKGMGLISLSRHSEPRNASAAMKLSLLCGAGLFRSTHSCPSLCLSVFFLSLIGVACGELWVGAEPNSSTHFECARGSALKKQTPSKTKEMKRSRAACSPKRNMNSLVKVNSMEFELPVNLIPLKKWNQLKGPTQLQQLRALAVCCWWCVGNYCYNNKKKSLLFFLLFF